MLEKHQQFNPGEAPQKEQAAWFEGAAKKWQAMDWGERQYWLAQVADERQLPKMRFVMTHKHFDFGKIPVEYQGVLAKKWGLAE